jgi:hypothetical protein
MPDFAAYGAARNALIQAQQRVAETPGDEQALQALQTAGERLRETEEPIRAEIDQAWDNNVAARIAANQAFTDARQALTAAELEIGAAIRARGDVIPNVEEAVRLQDAHDAVEAARSAVAVAKQTLKAGVTVEQLEAI